MAEEKDASIDVAVGVVDGKVVAQWHRPTARIVFDPQNAFQIGEALARAAHEARFPGEKLPQDGSYIARQVRAKLTEDLRVRMINRVSLMMQGEQFRTWTPGKQAMHLVDAIFREVA
jgi:hypothetical protein